MAQQGQNSVQPSSGERAELQDTISTFLYLYLVLNGCKTSPRDLRNLSFYHYRTPKRLKQGPCETCSEDSEGSVFLDWHEG